jgi:hypothetical protein
MEINDTGQSLLKAFEQVPDPRSARGRRHPLPAILVRLGGSVSAMFSGAKSLYAIAQCRDYPKGVVGGEDYRV